jgi:hypothetical protein
MTNPYFVNHSDEEDLQWKNPLNEDNLQRKMASEYYNWNISATTLWIVNYEFMGRN